ncbi:hypothetical protein D7U74_01160 [Stenotrophomonas maltophilia]|uniref:hypothetical protein n=1 Tax=Stenotrophomonas maltophilia TaxID=40324 RepID=UPI0015DF0C94|nr:hypothetical protein [Stenotrophomonas maltophilia]MBA0220170.1 hypothetical protein [Stenotrophomonas maltophilia]
MNAAALLLRWLLLAALVLTAPGLARAASGDGGQGDMEHCAALHETAVDRAGCCGDRSSGDCGASDCPCPPACTGVPATSSAVAITAWREAPRAALARRPVPPPLTDALRPPIV